MKILKFYKIQKELGQEGIKSALITFTTLFQIKNFIKINKKTLFDARFVCQRNIYCTRFTEKALYKHKKTIKNPSLSHTKKE